MQYIYEDRVVTGGVTRMFNEAGSSTHDTVQIQSESVGVDVLRDVHHDHEVHDIEASPSDDGTYKRN
jgi:hypothetical protein